MIQLHNLNLSKIEKFTDLEENLIILEALDKIIDLIKDPNHIKKIIFEEGYKNSALSIYPSICMLLGEIKELVSNDIDIEELVYEYMVIIKQMIESGPRARLSLFGGLSDLGYGINSIYKATGYYKKFINSFNSLIISLVEKELYQITLNANNLRTEYFDTISGITGVTSYLLLYKDDYEVRQCIEKTLNYLVSLTRLREVFGEKVPSYYLASENHYLQEEREYYSKGSFNLGLSHGISGPLSILSIALSEGIEVEGQREAIKSILNDFKEFCYITEEGFVYWPGRISFDDYVNKNNNKESNRASWCYGTPGIARAIYLAGQAIEHEESVSLSLKAIDGLCKMSKNEWMLNSPTICHGYAGLLAVMEAMYIDTGNIKYQECINKLRSILLSLYKKDSLFGFMNIDPLEKEDGKIEIAEEDNITLLQGSIGVILTLLATIKPITTNWEKHLLIR